MSDYSKKDLRAVNLLSLILVAVGGFFILSTIISHVDNRSPSEGPKSKVVDGIAKKQKIMSLPNGYFVKRYILGAVFALCGVALHFVLKQQISSKLEADSDTND